jgi:hypothetical protein
VSSMLRLPNCLTHGKQPGCYSIGCSWRVLQGIVLAQGRWCTNTKGSRGKDLNKDLQGASDKLADDNCCWIWFFMAMTDHDCSWAIMIAGTQLILKNCG